MDIKADENMPSRVVRLFRENGHDVATTAEEGMNGKPDEIVFAAAVREHRMILTLDRGFGDIRAYVPGSHPGIILLRSPEQSVPAIERSCRRFLAEHDLSTLAGCTVIVQPGLVRVRRA